MINEPTTLVPSRIYPLTALPFKNIIRPKHIVFVTAGNKPTPYRLARCPLPIYNLRLFKPIHQRLRRICKQRPS